MKKIYLIFIIGFMIFTGCSLPAESSFNEASNTLSGVSGQATTAVRSDQDTTEKVSSEDKKNDSKTLIILYYQDSQGFLIPVTRRVEKQLALANLAIRGLIDSPINREELEYFGLYPVLPQGTEILGINIIDKNAVIDFNEKLLDYETETAERSIISSIVYTLTEFNTIDRVKILIKGQTIKNLKFNIDLSDYLSRDNVLVNSNEVNLEQGFKKLDIYLFKGLNNNFSYIAPISIKLPDFAENELPEKIISCLVNEKISEDLYSQLPQNLILNGSEIKKDVLDLDFSKEILEIGGNAREDGIVKQILFSAGQIKGIKKVMLSVNGKSEYLTEGTDISKEFDIPSIINDYIDKE